MTIQELIQSPDSPLSQTQREVLEEEYNDLLLSIKEKGEKHPKFKIGDTIKKKSTGYIISEIDLKNRGYRLSNTGFIPFKYEYLWELVEQKHSSYLEILSFIDSLQEEPKTDWLQELQKILDSLSKEDFKKVWAKYKLREEEPMSLWHDVSEEPKPNMELICVGQYGNPLVLSSNSDSFKSRDISKWAYFNDLLNLYNVQRTGKGWKEEPVSEDERIRQELIQFFSDKDEEDYEGMHPRAQILAYLEKQGEQKPIIEMKSAEESLGIDSETYSKIVDECIYGEQKHTPKPKVGDTIYYNSFGEVKSMIVANVTTDSTNNPMYEDENGNAVFEEDLIEQKSAWTPMDAQHVENLLAIIEGHGYPGEVAWLNSLKDRIQPKQEWSNWDKTIIESIEALCDEKIESVVFQDVKEHVNDIKDWLKSLKDRVQPQPKSCRTRRCC